MRKAVQRISILLVIALALVSVIGCAKDEAPAAQAAKPAETTSAEISTPAYQDGIYFAQEDGFSGSGWKYVVTLKVEDGKITEADWNGANKNGGEDKKTVSAEGKYGMVARGGAQAEWHEQAEKAESYLLKVQDPEAIVYTDDSGHTDDISGVSIHVVEFFDLAEAALAAGPVGRGPYTDGHYHAQEPQFNERTGWRYSVDLTVIGGNIVAASWNGANRDGGTDKITRSTSGAYGMVAFGNAQAEWHEQAAKAEAYLLKTQDPKAIEYTDDSGHTDDIAGVSIHVVEFFELAEAALAAGPVKSGPYANGHYYAEAAEPASSGWKSTVALTVIDGRIFAANWSAVNADGKDKKTESIEGNYGMVARGGAQAEWHEQAYAVEDYLLEIQDPSKAVYDADGYTDAVSGASIHVNDFFELAEAALAAGPVKN